MTRARLRDATSPVPAGSVNLVIRSVGRFVASALALGVATIVVLGFASPAQAAARTTGEGTTPAFDVTMVVQPDGTVDVTENITYSFFSDGHGIERYIPDRYPYPPDANFVRVLTISGVSVSSPSGAPPDVQQSQQGDYLYLRIGNPDQLVSGTQKYVLSYQVTGALNTFPTHAELYWNAVPALWASPVAHSHVTVSAPAISDVACFAGPVGSNLSCDRSVHTSARAQFVGHGVGDGSALTVVVGMPVGAVVVPPAQLERKWTIGHAFSIGGWHLPVAALVTVLGIAAVIWLVWHRGRDRRYAGLTPGLLPPTALHLLRSCARSVKGARDRSSGRRLRGCAPGWSGP